MTIFEVMHDVFVKIGLSAKASGKAAFCRKQKKRPSTPDKKSMP